MSARGRWNREFRHNIGNFNFVVLQLDCKRKKQTKKEKKKQIEKNKTCFLPVFKTYILYMISAALPLVLNYFEIDAELTSGGMQL